MTNFNNFKNYFDLRKERIPNYILYLYILSYIAGPAVINLYVTLISIVALFFLFKNKNIIIKQISKSSLIAIFFIIYVFFFMFFKNNFNVDVISLIRFIIILILIDCLKNRFSLDKLHLINFFFLITAIISIDSFIQFFFGKNLFGFQLFEGYRLTSFFNDEPIVGSFLMKFVVPLSFFLVFSEIKIIKLLVILLGISVIVLSSERMPVIQLIFCINIFLFFIKDKKKFLKYFFFIIVLLSIVISISLNNNNLKNRYSSTFFDLKTLVIEKNIDELNFKNTSVKHYLDNFSSGLKMWKIDIFFGNGYRAYKKDCSIKLDNHIGCSTHPHNILIEILSDYGLFGFVIYALFIYYLFIEIFKSKFSRDYFGFIIVFVAMIFPFFTSQSIFSSYYGSIFFFLIFLLKILSEKE